MNHMKLFVLLAIKNEVALPVKLDAIQMKMALDGRAAVKSKEFDAVQDLIRQEVITTGSREDSSFVLEITKKGELYLENLLRVSFPTEVKAFVDADGEIHKAAA